MLPHSSQFPVCNPTHLQHLNLPIPAARGDPGSSSLPLGISSYQWVIINMLSLLSPGDSLSPVEMEEVLLQLWGEVARLQELCSEQGRLLRRLRARKGPVLGEWGLRGPQTAHLGRSHSFIPAGPFPASSRCPQEIPLVT